MITSALIKELRERTGAGMMDCKKALTETDGNIDKAIEFLREKGLSSAGKKSGRVAAEGVVSSYIHMGGKIGVLVEVNCETDFVAKNDDFQSFAKDIAMHIAAASPEYLTIEDVPAGVIEKERTILKHQAINEGKPENIAEKMVEGRIKKMYKDICLMEQPYVKNPDQTISDLLKEKISVIGENIVIRRFTRYQMGEGLEKKEENFAEEIQKQIQSV